MFSPLLRLLSLPAVSLPVAIVAAVVVAAATSVAVGHEHAY